MSDFQIKVVAFGIARDIIGGRDTDLQIPENCTAAQAMVQLKDKFPDFEQLASLNLAINEEYVNDDYQINKGDELVLIPPVSGG